MKKNTEELKLTEEQTEKLTGLYHEETNFWSVGSEQRANEPRHDKPTKWLCTQWRLRSAWASAQSDQSLRCPHEESLGP